jgi:predicted acetyltransferase
MSVVLVRPARRHLASYEAALRRGWSPDNVSPRKTAEAQLARIAADPEGFLAEFDLREPRDATIELPDGTLVPRLPGFTRWIWDGELAGSLNLRWLPGTSALPPHLLGHVGYAVVPWKRRRGYATRALGLLLDDARAVGLDRIEITTDPDNLASRRVIEANGGQFVERGPKPAAYGEGDQLRFRIALRP